MKQSKNRLDAFFQPNQRQLQKCNSRFSGRNRTCNPTMLEKLANQLMYRIHLPERDAKSDAGMGKCEDFRHLIQQN